MTENAEKKEKKNDGWVIRVQFFPKDGKIKYFTFDMLYYQDRGWIRDLEKIIPTGEVPPEDELSLNEVHSMRRMFPLSKNTFVLVAVPIYDHIYLIEVVDGTSHVNIFRSEEELMKYVKETYRIDLTKVRP
jgi:hypothetical protein